MVRNALYAWVAALTLVFATPAAAQQQDPGQIAAAEQAVLAANDTFYRAFAGRDIAGMASLWAETGIGVTHPGWPRLDGRAPVMRSWRQILGSPNSPDISYSMPEVRILGETAAVRVIEHLPNGSLRALNIFAIQSDGTWRMIDHRALPATPATDT